MKAIVQAGQTLFDIAIQEYGTLESVMQLAKVNNLSITEVLMAGQVLDVPDQVYDKKVADYCKNNQITPATADEMDSLIKLRVFSKIFSKEFA